MAVSEQSVLQVALIILAIASFVIVLFIVEPYFSSIINGGKIIAGFLTYIDGFVQLGHKIAGLFGWIGKIF